MGFETLISYVVSSYELTPREAEKVRKIAEHRVQELSLTEFDNVYNYVVDLIERFKNAFEARGTVSIDAPSKDNPEIALRDWISSKESTKEMFKGEDKGEKLEDLLEHLKDKLKPEEVDTVLKLAERSEYQIRVGRTEYIETIPQIREKLHEIAEHFRNQKGQLLIPPRPILSVQFHPITIRYGQRRFNGDPLGFFNDHPEIYSGISRGQLARFDRGLYDSLKRAGQLGEVPQKLRYYSGDPLSYFLKYTEDYQGLTRRDLFRKDPGLYNSLRKAGQLDMAIPEKHIAGELSAGEIQEIADALQRNGRNIAKTSRELGFNGETVKKYGIRQGILAKNREKGLPQDVIALLLNSLRKNHGDIPETVRELGVCERTARKYASLNSIPLRDMRGHWRKRG